MSTTTHANGPERTLELLADRATQGLSAPESRECEALLAEHPELDDELMDMAAAALDLAWLEPAAEPLPTAVTQRVEGAAVRWMAERRNLEVARPAPSRSPATRRSGQGISLGLRLMPWFAAAACLALALLAWLPTSAPTFAEARADLLARATDAVSQTWTATDDAAANVGGVAATGDVVWSDAAQRGYMRFKGLAANDPTKSQYQLWIFDTTQPEPTPIDGGVFDIDPATGEVIVPIRAKLRVARPWLFAVTVEKPGGVVVSQRTRLPVL
ncbi:MAG: anti-sigma factor, partial [Planctomycetota bacterium]